MNYWHFPALLRLLPSTTAFALVLAPIATYAAPGDLYEADSGTGTIFKFAPNGAKASFVSGLFFPEGVAFDASGNVFVTDNQSVLKFTPNGTKSTFASGLVAPNAMAFDGSGNLFV